MPIKKVGTKTQSQIVQEWDEISEERLKQIDGGDDRSFSEVLAPSIVEIIRSRRPERVVDVGCGTGTLTEMLSRHAEHVVGIDPSSVSIQLAKQHHLRHNIEYIPMSAESYAPFAGGKFDLAVSNMVMMDASNLILFLQSIYLLLKPHAEFVATITNPHHWPTYWGYQNADWFDPDSELFIEAPFTIASGALAKITTHIHRPLEFYINSLKASGFYQIVVDELMPPQPIVESIDYDLTPRFLKISARRDVNTLPTVQLDDEE